jgi:inosine/guanosine/xanthosine phosphorylase family protein
MTGDMRMAAITAASSRLGELTGGVVPSALVVLGSGLSGVVEAMDVSGELSFGDLPGFAASAVVGHAGRFVFGHVGTTPVLVMMGRLHLYEGHPIDQVVLPVRATAVLGTKVLIVTNAAGGITADLHVGQTMLIADHINLLGVNPLTGPNLDALGTRFPPMAGAYSPRLNMLAVAAAEELGMDLAEGVYAAVPGPSYETVAEVHALRAMGADAVGMSTVPEVIAGVHVGMEVAGFSLIANVAADVGHGHADVLAAVGSGTPLLTSLLAAILGRL